ncbi:MAG: hypothetical protein II977_07430 [Oscillospiraceae bacterium]|nr:hypothetical protein [Oscillospiraceae bacterium]
MNKKNWEDILTEKAEISQMNRAKNGEMIWVLPLLYVAAYMLVDMMVLRITDISAIMNGLLKGGFVLAGACMMLAGWLYDHAGNTIFHCITDEKGKELDKLLKKRKLYAAVMGGVPAAMFIAGIIMQMTGQTETYELMIKPRTALIYIAPAVWGIYSLTITNRFKAINSKING